MSAYVLEKQIVRTGTITNGTYIAESGEIGLTIETDGTIIKFRVHPDTASKFHCGKKVTITVTTDG